MKIQKLLHGRCIVKIQGRTDLQTTLLLPDLIDDHGTHKPYTAELVMIGVGRIAQDDRRPVPTVADLGWRPGDTVVCLKKFAHLKGSDLGLADGDYALIDDFDVLCRINGGLLEPNYGRTLVKLVADETTSDGGILLPGAPKAKKQRMGRVVATAPRLNEETGSVAQGQRAVTLKYHGIVEDSFGVGDTVLFEGWAAWTFKADGQEYVAINNTSVLTTVDDPACVETT